MTEHHHTRYDIPASMGGGSLKTAWEALFDAAHEHDAGEWAMPAMLGLVTIERIGDAPPQPGHEGHGHGAWAMAAHVADRATEGFNSGVELINALNGFAHAINTMPPYMVRPWLGLGPDTRVIGAAMLCELWTVPVANDDVAAEAEVHAWLAAHDGRVSEHPDAVEMRVLVGLDLFGYMYRLRMTRGAETAYSTAVALPGLAGPGKPEDLAGIDTLLDPRELRGIGFVLAALARLTDPEDGGE